MKVKIEGLDELKKRLRELKPELAEKALARAARAGAVSIKKAVVQAAPYDEATQDGVHIKQNVVVGRSRRRSGPGRLVMTIGVKLGTRITAAVGKRKKGRKVKTEGFAWYWRLLEFGTKKMGKKPFMQRAAAGDFSNAIQAVTKSMAKAIADYARKNK